MASISNCYLARATEVAGIKTERVTAWSAAAAILAALVAYLAVTQQVRKTAQYGIDAEQRFTDRRRRQLAGVYLAEIDALKSYLQENDILEYLTSDSPFSALTVVHPGDHWLESYLKNPDHLENFEGDLSAAIVSYMVEMHQQVKNLRAISDAAGNNYFGPYWSDLRRTTAEKLIKLESRSETLCSALSRITQGAERGRVW
jgi:hypothetical protein